MNWSCTMALRMNCTSAGSLFHRFVRTTSCLNQNMWTPQWSAFDAECVVGSEQQSGMQRGVTLEPIFSEGLLFGKKGPPTLCRKYSKCRTRKRMARCGFLARVRTYNGRKILQRQRAKGRRYLGAKL